MLPSRAPYVLVVDDTVANRFVVRRILESEGYRVVEAGNGAEVKRLLAERIPDIVVLDVRLPDANGFELTRYAKSHPRLAQIPVLLLSASFTTDEARTMGLDAGADGYLTHPVEPPVLLATVRSLLRARQSERRVFALYATSAALAAAMNRDDIADVLVRDVFPAIEADAGAIAVVSREDGGIVWLPGSPYADVIAMEWGSAHDEGVNAMPSGPARDAIHTGRPVVLQSASEWAVRYPAVASTPVATAYETTVVLPCLLNGRTLGALMLAYRAARAVDEEDLRFLGNISQQCAQAIDRAWLYQTAQQAQLVAESANRAKMEFLATMSHEFRTPLNAIAGYAELIALGVRGPLTAEQRHDVERILSSQKHLLGLINEVLNYARLENGRLEYDLIDTPVGPILESLDSFIAPQVRERGIGYERQVADADVCLRADRERVQQILLNLLSNAIKFTPSGGHIVVKTDSTEEDVAIQVIDTGRGIPAAKLEAIFEPFVQVGRRLTGEQQGTGLGLSISRELARGMGGELTVESEPGVGSTFTLRLPRAVAAVA